MQRTIYFQSDIWEKLSQEDHKSALINKLLAEHYNVSQRDVTQHEEVSDDTDSHSDRGDLTAAGDMGGPAPRTSDTSQRDTTQDAAPLEEPVLVLDEDVPYDTGVMSQSGETIKRTPAQARKLEGYFPKARRKRA